MKLLMFLIVIWAVWCTINVTPVWTITFDLTGSTTVDSYSTSVKSLRDRLESGEKFNIPILQNPSSVPINQRFVLVDLKASTEQTLTLVIQVTDLYLLAYRDKVEGKKGEKIDRINFFRSTSSRKEIKALFPAGAKERDISVGENYIDLEKVAGDRKNIELGIIKLRKQIIDKIFGKQTIDRKEEAKFIIVAVQMVSEAVRFKYIENQVKRAGTSGAIKPDYKVLILEKNWDKISKAIQKSKDKNISPPIDLVDPNNKPWKVTSVDQIAPDMGLLKYAASQKINLMMAIPKIIRSYP